VKFIIDAQLPPGLAKMLCEQGANAVAVRDIGLRDASDSQIWQYALQNQAAIITQGRRLRRTQHEQPTIPSYHLVAHRQ